MDELKSKDYQTYILFFSWTVGLIATVLRLFVEIEDPVKYVLVIMLLDIFLNLGSKHKRFNPYAIKVLILILIFYGWLLFSISYSPSRSYKYDKALYFIANIIFFI